MKILNKKNLLILCGLIGLGIGTSVLLTSCKKEEPKTSTSTEYRITSYNVQVKIDSPYYSKLSGETFHFAQGETFNFTVNDFSVDAFKENGELVSITNFNVVYDSNATVSGGVDVTYVKIVYNSDEIKAYRVEVENGLDILPSLTGVTLRNDGSYYYYVLDQEIVYSGEEVDPLTYIGTSTGESISTLISQGKIQSLEGSEYKKTNAGDQYAFTLCCNNDNYFSVNNEKVAFIDIHWSIKKAEIAYPTVTNTTIEYSPLVDSNGDYIIKDDNTLDASLVGPTIDYHGKESFFNVTNDKQKDVGKYEMYLSLKLEYQDNYNLTSTEENENSYYLNVNWEITPKVLSIDSIHIDETSHLSNSDNMYHYEYTGEEIIPHLNVPNSFLKLFDVYGETNVRVYEDDKVNKLVLRFKDFLNVDNGKIKSFVFSNGNPIDAEKIIDYIIDKKQMVLEGLDETHIKFKDIPYLTRQYLSYTDISFDEYDSLFNDETKTYLANLAGFDINYLHIHYDSPDGGFYEIGHVGTYPIVLDYYRDYNYEPIRLELSLKVVAKEIELNPSWSYVEGTSNYSQDSVLYYIQGDGYIDLDDITYIYKFSLDYNGQYGQINNYTDAGFYKKIALLPENEDFVYLYEGAEVTEVYIIYEVERTNYSLGFNYNDIAVIYDEDNSTLTRELSSFCIDNLTKEFVIDSSSINPTINSFFTKAFIIEKYVSDEDLEVVQSSNAIGKYRLTYRLTFKDGINYHNYKVDNGAYGLGQVLDITKDFYVYPSTITIDTQNSSNPNYVGYGNLPARYDYKGEYQWENPVPQNLPDGIKTSYSYTYSNSNGIYTSNAIYGSEGTFSLTTSLSIDTTLYGYERTTITLNGEVVTAYKTNTGGYICNAGGCPYEFTIGPDESSIVSLDPYGTSSDVQSTKGYGYYKFTISNEDVVNGCGGKYLVVLDGDIINPEGDAYYNLYDISCKKDGTYTYYSRVTLQRFDSTQYYFFIDGVENNDTFYIRVKYYAGGQDASVSALPYFGQLDIVQSYDEVGQYVERLEVVKLFTANANQIFIPEEVTLPNSIVPYKVTKINANAFNDEVQSNNYAEGTTNIYLPRTITEVEDAALKISTLERVYFDGTLEEWNAINFGNGVFDVSSNITVYIGEAQYTLNTSTYELVEK